MKTITIEEARAMKKKPHKYRALPTTVDGIRFPSKGQAERYRELKLLERAGLIFNLRCEVACPLYATQYLNKIGDYVADFIYFEGDDVVVEDFKGFRTPLYRWKKKHFEAQYGIKIRETSARKKRK
jgi:hypothetical protein